MKNRLSLKHRWAIWLTMFACLAASRLTTAQESPAKDSVYVAATVLDKDVYLRFIKPAEVARNRAKLSEQDFVKWQSESRWRPLVKKVSHLVMSDWAKHNKVRPTREEIQEHFANEAKQHLQAYATPEGTKRVALAVGLATLTTVEWATAKALHEKYGGRIALSSFGGWVAIDGRNALLKEYAAAGKIRFHDPEIEEEFWVGVENPAVLDVTVSDPKRVSNHFARPPWEGWGIRTAQLFEENPQLLKIPEAGKDHPVDADPADKGVNRSHESGGK